MEVYLEHANITVRNLDRAVRFLRTAFPHFKIRFDSKVSPGRWIHIGTDTTYIALAESPDYTGPLRTTSAMPGVNHVGFVVDDLDAVKQRLRAAGYEESSKTPSHPHRKRFYVRDDDDLEWEFVQYLSEDPVRRNDYTMDG